MTSTKIYTAAAKQFMSKEHLDLMLTALFTHPENEWFAPTNSAGEHYSICQSLAEAHLIPSRRTPIWIDSSFKGVRVEFFYNKEFNY